MVVGFNFSRPFFQRPDLGLCAVAGGDGVVPGARCCVGRKHLMLPFEILLSLHQSQGPRGADGSRIGQIGLTVSQGAAPGLGIDLGHKLERLDDVADLDRQTLNPPQRLRADANQFQRLQHPGRQYDFLDIARARLCGHQLPLRRRTQEQEPDQQQAGEHRPGQHQTLSDDQSFH